MARETKKRVTEGGKKDKEIRTEEGRKSDIGEGGGVGSGRMKGADKGNRNLAPRISGHNKHTNNQT